MPSSEESNSTLTDIQEEKSKFSSLVGLASVFLLWCIIALFIVMILLAVYQGWISPSNSLIQSVLPALHTRLARIIFVLFGIGMFDRWLYEAYSNLPLLGLTANLPASLAIKKIHKSVPELYTKLFSTNSAGVVFIWFFVLGISLFSAFSDAILLFFCATIVALILPIILVIAISIVEHKLHHVKGLRPVPEENRKASRIVVTLTIASILLVSGFGFYCDYASRIVQQKESNFSQRMADLNGVLSKISEAKIIASLDKITTLNNSITDTNLPLSEWIKQLDPLSTALSSDVRQAKQNVTVAREGLQSLLAEASFLPSDSMQLLNGFAKDLTVLLDTRINTYDTMLQLTAANSDLITFTRKIGAENIASENISNEEATKFSQLLDQHDQSMQRVYEASDRMLEAAKHFQVKLAAFKSAVS